MGCSKLLATKLMIYMKMHTSTAQEQTVDFQEQELGVIVARLVLG